MEVHQLRAQGPKVHLLAHVEGSAIGLRTRVWQFASVIRNARIGEDCNIATGAIVDGAEIGDRCTLGHGAFVGPGSKIGKDVFIGPGVKLCNDYWPRVDKDGWFDIDKLISGEIVVISIKDGASIGANAVVMPGVTIGRGAMVAASAVVDRNVPDEHLFRRDCTISKIDPERVIIRAREVRV